MIKTEINLSTLTNELFFREISLDKLCQQIRLLPEDTQTALKDFDTLQNLTNLKNSYHTLTTLLNTGISKNNYPNEIKTYCKINPLEDNTSLTYDFNNSNLIYQDQTNHYLKSNQYTNALETLSDFLANYIATMQLNHYYKHPVNFADAYDLIYPILNNISR